MLLFAYLLKCPRSIFPQKMTTQQSVCAPLCRKSCAAPPFLALVMGELGASDPNKGTRDMKQMLAQGYHRRLPDKAESRKPPEPQNQDSQHKLNQPRRSLSEGLLSLLPPNPRRIWEEITTSYQTKHPKMPPKDLKDYDQRTSLTNKKPIKKKSLEKKN